MQDKKNRLAVLVTSCDVYSDVWEPFFCLMDKYWTNIPYTVYLNTETKKYDKKHENFEVQTINVENAQKAKKMPWSKRMISVLKRIPEEYVFILIEDFFLRETVQTERIENILDAMDKDKLMSQIQFFGTRTNCDAEKLNNPAENTYMEIIGDDKAKVCFVPTIWRKSVLLKWLRPWETIWGFERLGAQRARRWKYKEKSYRVYAPAIFNYLWEKGCYCVVNGKWMLHPLLTNLFVENNIVVNFNERGTITMEEWNAVTTKDIMKRYTFWQKVKKAINRVRSFF